MDGHFDSIQREEDEELRLSKASANRKLGRRKRKRDGLSEAILRCDQFDEDCLQLERELDELHRDFEEDYRRHHWFTGVTIFFINPIHSA